MPLAVVVAMVAMGCAMILAIAGAAMMSDLLAKVNQRLPPGERLGFGRMTDPWRGWKALAAYRRLYPEGTLRRRYFVVVALQLGFFAVCVAALLWVTVHRS